MSEFIGMKIGHNIQENKYTNNEIEGLLKPIWKHAI